MKYVYDSIKTSLFSDICYKLSIDVSSEILEEINRDLMFRGYDELWNIYNGIYNGVLK